MYYRGLRYFQSCCIVTVNYTLKERKSARKCESEREKEIVRVRMLTGASVKRRGATRVRLALRKEGRRNESKINERSGQHQLNFAKFIW